MPNWKHLPVGYHGRGRAPSSCRAPTSSGPAGQRKTPTQDAPDFGPSGRLDIEAEMGFLVGVPIETGRDRITP